MIEVVEFFEPYGEKNRRWSCTSKGAHRAIQSLSNKSGGANHSSSPHTASTGGRHLLGERETGKDFDTGSLVDVVFRLGRNYFRNREPATGGRSRRAGTLDREAVFQAL